MDVPPVDRSGRHCLRDSKSSDECDGRLVLYVDDVWWNRLVFDLSFRVDFTAAAADRANAAGVLVRRDVSLLLLDIHRDDTAGLELLTTTKARWPCITCILVAVEPELEDVQAVIRSQLANHVVSKPRNRGELAQLMRRVLASRPVSAL